MTLHTVPDAEAILRMPKGKLYDKRYRKAIGLRAIKVGKKLLFRDQDIEELIERGLEDIEDDGKQEASSN